MPGEATRSRFRTDVQGLRAVAVVAVLLFHAGIPGFAGGFVGVDVFFVISGYLIGGQLISSLLATGRIDLAGFYARRARRILPAALVVILLTVLAALVLAPPVRLPEILGDAVWAALSAVNIRLAVDQTDYFAGSAPSPLQHYWSLGVEEQFYLLVPLTLIGLFALVRRSPRRFLVAGAVLIVGSFALCLALGAASPWTFYSLPTRAWELGVGALAAGLAPRLAGLGMRWAAALAGIGIAALAGGTWLAGLPGVSHPGIVTLAPVLGTALVIVAGIPAGSPTIVARALSLPPMQALGALSYSLYLVHWPMLALARERLGAENPLPTAAAVGLMLAAVPLAWVLYRVVERPALDSRRLSAWRPARTIALGGGVTAVVVAGLLGTAPAVASISLSVPRVAAEVDPTPLPTGTDYVPSNMRPSLMDAEEDTGSLYADGCQQNKVSAELLICRYGSDDGATVVLFGDSHAGRWFPALEAAFAGEQVQIVTLVKSGCRSIETEKLWAGAENTSCAEWRQAAEAYLVENPPDLLVLANHVGFDADRDPEKIEEQWRGAALSTLDRFAASTAVAVLAETPAFSFSPPVCLSTHLDDADACSASRSEAVNSAVIAGVGAGTTEGGGEFIDLTDWFCGPERCPTVIGARLAFTDEHHMSATFSAALGDVLRDRLDPLLPALATRD